MFRIYGDATDETKKNVDRLYFQCKEQDAYTGNITLYNDVETYDDIITVMYIAKDYLVVTVECEDETTFQKSFNPCEWNEAYNCYKLQAGFNTSGIN